ncbi:MAG: Gfo/Idh/MocA family oxidoreductase [bacterium]|nr:Gfo/Idh/MocA family oxidoreductase [bacterium]MDD3805968.1 Gfo/Idh/MocA family oxidoreductase [bacterium]MDD4557986.1 Gfo/Idh/MocA family oxidoreductase [bacterium]
MFNVAVIGAGTMGGIHAGHYDALPDSRVVAVLDIRLEAAESLAETYSASAYDNMEKMLAEENIDIVSITTPTPYHKECVLTAAAAGKHIFCEKPIAMTTEEGLEMTEACRKAGVAFMVGHVLRYFPEYAAAKAMIDNGAVGKIGMVRTSRGGSFPRASGDWYADKGKSGGLVLDMLIHDFDWLRWSLGDVTRVYAKGLVEKAGEHKDYALVTLRFANGAIAHVEGTWMRPDGFKTCLEVAGDKGLIAFNNDDSAPIKLAFTDSGRAGNAVAVPNSPLAEEDDPYRLEIIDFLKAIKREEEPPISGEDAVEALKISLAVLESIFTGQPVEVLR